MSFDGKTTKSSDTVELLGITLDKNINFKRHIQNICRKVKNKTNICFCIRTFLNLEQAPVVPEPYISSSFRYCPLIWMFCSKMMKTHYRTLEELLQLSEEKKIHTQNLQILMVEV